MKKKKFTMLRLFKPSINLNQMARKHKKPKVTSSGLII
jgi:hypothetical protein